MGRFVSVDRDTAYWLPPSVQEWLPELGTVQALVADSGFMSTVEPVIGIINTACRLRRAEE